MRCFTTIIVICCAVSIYGCRKAPANSDVNLDKKEIIEQISIVEIAEHKRISGIFYVAPPDGLNLRSEPNLNSTKIRALAQYAKLDALHISDEKETIDGINDYWYEVDTGEETGWVFGGYLIVNPGRNSAILKKPVILKEGRDMVFEFDNGKKGTTWKDTVNLSINYIKVYDETSRQSNYTELHNTYVHYYKLDETDDWLYILDEYKYDEDGDNIHGYVFLYDIHDSRNNYDEEEEIINTYGNIKRYGPILIIYHNHNIFRFGNSFTGELGAQDVITGYYPERDEAIIKQYYEMENRKFSMFNFNLNGYSAEDSGAPFFSPSRNRFISLQEHNPYNSIIDSPRLLRVYSRDNNSYEKIFEQRVYFSSRDITNVSWITDNDVKIEYDEDNITLQISTDGKVRVNSNSH